MSGKPAQGTRRTPTLRTARRTFSDGLTTRGRAFLTSGIAGMVCAVALGYPELLRVAILLAALPLAAAIVVTASRYRIGCRRSLDPARVPVGSQARVTLRLENAARLPSSPLLVEDQVPYTLGSRPRFVLRRIEPGGTRSVAYRVRSDSRGRYPLGPLSLRTADPLGLFELTRAFTTQHTLTVSPKVDVLPPITLGTVWTGRGDGHAAHAAAAGEDDVGVREYRYGDELRRIHWRATAHHGEMMVRREEQTWHSRATILLDDRAEAHRGSGPTASLEWAVSAAASSAIHLLRSGYAVTLATASGAPLGPADSEDAVLDALAVLRPVHAVGLVPPAQSDDRADGLLIAVLGAISAQDATDLVAARPSSSSAVAFLLDTRAWNGTQRVAGLDPAGTAAVLEAGGWKIAIAGYGESFPDLWRSVSRHSDTYATEPLRGAQAADVLARAQSSAQRTATPAANAAAHSNENGHDGSRVVA